MPQKKKEDYNSYMRVYMLKRYKQRMETAHNMLGNKCAKCGSTSKLELDYVDRSTKSFTIGKLWSISNKRFIEEIKKCQLLCRTHHQEKTLVELGQKSAKDTHGTLSSYRWCKCDTCKESWNKHSREYKRRKRLENGLEVEQQRP